MSPWMQALLSAVLPQDLYVKGVTKWSEKDAMVRRREGRIVGKLVLAGMALGVGLGYAIGFDISFGIIAGFAAGLLFGWCVIGWRRHQVAA